MENNILTDLGDVGRPRRVYIRPQRVKLNMDKLPNYRINWLPIKKNPIRNIRSSATRTFNNTVNDLVIITFSSK